jgi:hypothetical protein
LAASTKDSVVVNRVMTMPALRWLLTTCSPAGLGTAAGTPVGHLAATTEVGHARVLAVPLLWPDAPDDESDCPAQALRPSVTVSTMTPVENLLTGPGSRWT